MEINEFSHPDSIWTYKNTSRSHKTSVWIPYLYEVKKERKKHTYTISYNGGAVTINLAKVDCIMIYGPAGNLPVSFLDALGVFRIPLLIHRRNLSNPYCFLPAKRNDEKDMLTSQIVCRENQIRRVYIARTIIRERIKSFSPIIPLQTVALNRLQKARTLKKVRGIEAQCSKLYWKYYFEKCGVADISRRDKTQPINQALNACSVFLSGVFLRWILLHRLAPTHGFLHEPAGYPALVYDLMEPVRWWLEKAVLEAVHAVDKPEKIVAYAMETLKAMMEDTVYVPATHQRVKRKSIAHGLVLSLRAYLCGEMRRLVLPVQGDRRAGRPPKISYQLPGSIFTSSRSGA